MAVPGSVFMLLLRLVTRVEEMRPWRPARTREMRGGGDTGEERSVGLLHDNGFIVIFSSGFYWQFHAAISSFCLWFPVWNELCLESLTLAVCVLPFPPLLLSCPLTFFHFLLFFSSLSSDHGQKAQGEPGPQSPQGFPPLSLWIILLCVTDFYFVCVCVCVCVCDAKKAATTHHMTWRQIHSILIMLVNSNNMFAHCCFSTLMFKYSTLYGSWLHQVFLQCSRCSFN